MFHYIINILCSYAENTTTSSADQLISGVLTLVDTTIASALVMSEGEGETSAPSPPEKQAPTTKAPTATTPTTKASRYSFDEEE